MAGATALGVNLYHVARIVSSYVRHHRLGPDQFDGLIVAVHRALAGLGLQQPPQPAVPIRRSLRRDYVVCLECGFRTQALCRQSRGKSCYRSFNSAITVGGRRRNTARISSLRSLFGHSMAFL